MDNEDICVDEASPVVYAMKIETGVYALVMDFVHIVLEVGAVFVDSPNEEHTRVES